MADNVTLNSGTGGDTLAADDIGPGVKYQRVKLVLGADGVNDGDVASGNPLPVATHAVTQSGTWTVQPGNTANTTAWKVDASSVAVPVTDNAGSLTVDGTVSVSGTVTVDSELTTADLDTGAGTDTRAVVGVVVAASGGAINLSGNSGNKDGGTVRVVLATDQPQLTNALKVDGSAVTQPVSGTVTVTQATAANLKVDLSGTAANATAIKVDGSAVTQPVSGTVTATAAGQTAHDSASTGNPVRVGAKAETSLSGVTLVADADATDLYAGVDGVLIVRPHTNLEDVVQERTTNTDGASTAFASGLAAPGAGVRLWITQVTACNSSATFCTVDLRDGSAGSVLWTLPVPATGGAVQQFNPPLKLTANTALAFDASAATTTLTISANGFKSKV